MSKIRANTQVIPSTINRALVDTSFEADLVKFASDISELGTNKADLTYVEIRVSWLVS